ncbi:MAG: acyl-CoA-binding protein [Desulfobacterales bacterium]|nr:acyl-CoA-binding protein [Desulfobacterales bacterium]MBF0396842.1 acyl-CoA-binding protein [Desulfobacterales bacterium]
MSDLKTQFDEAVELVRTAKGNFKPSQNFQLEMYALFKQATEGDVHGKKPGFTDFVGKAKYGAWEKLKGKSQEEAMKIYIEKVNEIKAKY